MRYLQREVVRILKVLIPRGKTIALGPPAIEGVAEELEPSRVIRIEDIASPNSDKPDFVLLLMWLNQVPDIHLELKRIHECLDKETRVVVVSVSRLWNRLTGAISRQYGTPSPMNWIPPAEIANFFEQTGFEVISRRRAVLLPFRFPLISRTINRWMSDLPVLRHFSIFNILTIRPIIKVEDSEPSVSVIVAARNEEGNIRNLVSRLPRLSRRQELIFVEGGSQDQTWPTILEVIAEHTQTPNFEIRAFQQSGKGKGDAVRLGFQEARGDILIILDADLSVPPEELPRFIEVLQKDHCEFANGSRLVYQMERQAMQFLNLLGNRLFGVAFTFLLGQPIRDTLCGTKALWATSYRQIVAERSYFGEFDPFGDFDLLFGAARLSLKIRDIPVHYKERVYGSTNISRFRHGLLLLRMTALAARRIRFV